MRERRTAETPVATRKPRALRRGDLVGIAAPASPVREELLERGEAALRGLGLRVRRARHVLERSRYTAGTPEERASDLHELFDDPEVRAVLVARGGYGSPQLPPLLDPERFLRDPKILMGASDATALLLWSLSLGVCCLHGPMPAREFQEARVDLAEVWRHMSHAGPAGALLAPGARTLHPGRAEGRVTGGCLSLVVASLGTPWEIATRDCILFLEDVDTRPYQVDRMLTQLRQAGKLDGVRALAFGEMPGSLQHPDQGYTLDEVLADLTADLGIPVLSGLPCGHTGGIHRPLPFGIQASLDTDPPALSFLESFVS